MNDPKSLLYELKKAVVGKDNVLIMALLAILARGHILLEDIPKSPYKNCELCIQRFEYYN